MKVYRVNKNSDMTEGRGSMVVVATFTTETLAYKFADMHTGVMGRRPKDGSWKNEKYGEWKVVEIDVLDQVPMTKKQAINSAKSKLSEEELKLLNII